MLSNLGDYFGEQWIRDGQSVTTNADVIQQFYLLILQAPIFLNSRESQRFYKWSRKVAQNPPIFMFFGNISFQFVHRFIDQLLNKRVGKPFLFLTLQESRGGWGGGMDETHHLSTAPVAPGATFPLTPCWMFL